MGLDSTRGRSNKSSYIKQPTPYSSKPPAIVGGRSKIHLIMSSFRKRFEFAPARFGVSTGWSGSLSESVDYDSNSMPVIYSHRMSMGKTFTTQEDVANEPSVQAVFRVALMPVFPYR